MITAPLVLVVEDNPLILMLVAEALRCAGCEVVSADSAETAMTTLEARAGDLDLVVADVDLGSTALTGFDVVRHARRLNPDVAVIYATGRSDEDVADHGVAGAVHLPKPYCPVRLCRLIASLTNHPVACGGLGPVAAAA